MSNNIPSSQAQEVDAEQQYDSALSILKRTSACTVAGGALGGSLAVFRNAPPLPHVLSMGVNSALVSFGFFSVRQLLVEPVLSQAGLSRKQQLHPHSDGLGATALAGALTGGLFMSRLGPRRAFSGALTASLLCTGAHWALNELSLLRILVLAKQEHKLSFSDLFPTVNMDMGGWSPVRRIPDGEYRRRLHERVKNLDARIEQLDADIAQLQKEKKQAA